jgi:hypothetical protein
LINSLEHKNNVHVYALVTKFACHLLELHHDELSLVLELVVLLLGLLRLGETLHHAPLRLLQLRQQTYSLRRKLKYQSNKLRGTVPLTLTFVRVTLENS